MSTTEPIKDLKKLSELKNYYLITNNVRNYALISVGVNTALRISDLLSLKWNDVYDFEKDIFKKHVVVIERKTDKVNKFVMNKNAIEALIKYKKTLDNISFNDYIFKSQKGLNKPISRNHAFRIVKIAADAVGLEGNISCHSLRKTFGYWSWRSGVPPVMIMSIYNHSSFEVTKRYLGIDQDDRDKVFMSINL